MLRIFFSIFQKKIFISALLLLIHSDLLALPQNWPQDGIIVQPEMNRDPLIAAFNDAQHSLQISAYKLDDEALIRALVSAVKRGVTVDVLVTKEIFKRNPNENESATPSEKLKKLGINVREAPPFYDQAHYKMILVDGTYALIGTGNMSGGSFDSTEKRKAERDFWFTVTNDTLIEELKRAFQADFTGEKTNLQKAHLVWGPDQGRKPFLDLINGAKSSLWIYQQDITDKEIAQALIKAAQKGIDVRLIMPPHPFNEKKDYNIPHQELIRQAGGHIGLITHWVSHAKVVMVDLGKPTQRAYLGSVNFYAPSLDKNRELGGILTDPAALAKVRSVFEADWEKADFTPRQPPVQTP